jgi:nicotinamidase-related amidase
MPNSSLKLRKEDCVLIVIDIQDKLMPLMAHKDRILENIVRLLKFSRIVGLPVILTEQTNLGRTLPEVEREIIEFRPIQKLSFSCFLNDEFVKALLDTGRRTLLLCGIEAHVCVAQTALHGLSEYQVQVICDAVSSRTEENWRVGLERGRQSGAVITSTEMLIFELLQRAGTDEFRAARHLVK